MKIDVRDSCFIGGTTQIGTGIVMNIQAVPVPGERPIDITSSESPGLAKPSRRTILFLAANPKGTPQLRLDEEVKKIEQGLERAKKRDQFRLVMKWAVTGDDLRRALLDYEPEIVHFAGHGSGVDGLNFEDDQGFVHEIPGDSLARLFELSPKMSSASS